MNLEWKRWVDICLFFLVKVDVKLTAKPSVFDGKLPAPYRNRQMIVKIITIDSTH